MKSVKMLMALVLVIFTLISISQQGGGYEIKKSILATGVGSSSGGFFVVNGTIGQFEASRESSGGGFSVSGGFWAVGVRPNAIFKNGFEN